jgi:hypothetical protein
MASRLCLAAVLLLAVLSYHTDARMLNDGASKQHVEPVVDEVRDRSADTTSFHLRVGARRTLMQEQDVSPSPSPSPAVGELGESQLLTDSTRDP